MRTASSFFAILLVFTLIGCDSGGVTGPRDTAPDSFESDLYAVVDADDAFASIQDATLDHEMSMHPVWQGDGSGFARRHRHPRGHGSHLGPALKHLGLDESQRQQIRDLMLDHRETIRAALDGLREANAELIEQANAERRAIIESHQAGEISRDEAHQQLRELSERTRQAIRNNPDNAPYLEQICDARRSLFEGIRAILDDEQRAMWDGWVAGLPGDCFQAE